MTKLLEWLSVATLLASVWATLLWGDLVKLTPEVRFHVFLSPVYFVIAVGLVSLVIVLYRTATFRDCPEAYEELRRQIEEARKDLKSKGFQFKSQ